MDCESKSVTLLPVTITSVELSDDWEIMWGIQTVDVMCAASGGQRVVHFWPAHNNSQVEQWPPTFVFFPPTPRLARQNICPPTPQHHRGRVLLHEPSLFSLSIIHWTLIAKTDPELDQARNQPELHGLVFLGTVLDHIWLLAVTRSLRTSR